MQSYAYLLEYDSTCFRFTCNRSHFDTQTTLIIQRQTCRVKQTSQKLQPLPQFKKVNIHLIVGIITIRQQPFLMLVKEKAKVGTIIHEDIYQVKDIIFIAFRRRYGEKSYDYADTTKDLQSIKESIYNDNFYFCYNYNLTLSLQKRYQQNFMQQMFFWNESMLRQFRGYGISKHWMIPVVQGFVKGFKFKTNESVFHYTLISRRSKYQSGTRYTSRGIDEDGYVANFVECQEIYCFDKLVISWVLLRGSVPLYWSQSGVTGGQLKILESASQKKILEKHFKFLEKQYGSKIAVVDLLSNKSGGNVPENQLQKKYQTLYHQTKQKGVYVNYDLNEEIGKNKNDVQGVIDRWVRKNTDKLCGDFFSFIHSNNSKISTQNKFIRVNCLDCLDRTNVVCFKTSQQMLKQFDEFIYDSNIQSQRIIFDNDFRQKHRQAWLENGDRISIIYSGTTSVASYLTKGEKTNSIFNNIGNKLKSLNRLYNSNINDTYKQQCIEWVLRTGQQSISSFYFDSNIKRKLNESEYCRFEEIILGIVTWNCAQVSPGEIDIEKLFEMPVTPDILVVCLQEVIELSTYNVLLGGNKGSQNKWIQSIERLMHLNDKNMIFVGWKDLVGVLTMIFVKQEHFQNINSVIWSEVKTGWKGNLGNKGSVGLSFKYMDSVITVLSCHLEAGEGKVSERLGNVESIHYNCFPIRNQHHQYQSSEFRFLVGDLNFRIDMNQEQIKQALYQIEKQRKNADGDMGELLDQLLALDQLLYQKSKGLHQILNEYQQAKIRFLPTYKYTKKTNQYDFKRVPSWCDRILYKANPLKIQVKDYNSKQNINNSDHKPVFGIFNLLVKKQDYQKRQMLYDVFMKW